MVDCINLKERYGAKYRVVYEESYYAERPEYRREEEPWLQILLCQNGHICPWGGTKLAACTRTAGRIAQRLREHPAAKVVQDGDDGVNAVFDVADFAAIAEIMRPRRRRTGRVMTEEETRRFMAAGVAHRFSAGATGINDAGAAQTSVPGGVPV